MKHITIALLTIFLTVTAQAQQFKELPMSAAQFEAAGKMLQNQRPFSGQEIDLLLRDLPEFLAISDTIADLDKSMQESAGGRLPREIEVYLIGRGWHPRRFVEVLGRVGAGLASLEMERTGTFIEEQKAAIEADPMLTQDQKNQMLSESSGMREQIKIAKSAIRLTDAEMDLVERNKEPLQRILGAE